MTDTEFQQKRDQVQKLVFGLVDSETNEARKIDLEHLLLDTWFGSLESIEEFMTTDDQWRFAAEYIANEYVQNA